MRRSFGASHPRRRRSDRRPHPLRVLATLAGVVLVLWLASPYMMNAYARWLIVSDEETSSDAVVALAGGAGERLAVAIQIFRRGNARELLITGPDVPLLPVYTQAESLTQGEAKRRIAVRRGVPAESIVLSLGPTSTLEEAQRSLLVAKERGWKSIIVVTSPFHTRRTRATFRNVFEDSGVAPIICHLPIGRSSDNPERWWKREADAMAVTTETIKLCFYAWNHRIWPWG